MKKYLLLSSILLCFVSHAQIYKWVDKHGNVHFGDKPPEKALAKEIQVQPKVINSYNSSQAQQWRKEYRKKKEKAREEASLKNNQNKQGKNKKKCDMYKRELALVEDPTSIFIIASEDELAYKTEAERNKKIKQLKGQVQKNCQ